MDITLHTRHIPKEHLNFENESANAIVKNGLCDSFYGENAKTLKENGISVIETRLTFNELDDFDNFKRLDYVFDEIEKAGLKIGLFCWFQYPPKNYDVTYLKCLEHNEELSISSLWDDKTLENYDKLYAILQKKYGDRIKFIYIGVYGDYGEVCFPSGVKHYLFSPKHGHAGFMCADEKARESFKNYLLEKYKNIDNLNTAWKENFTSFSDDLMPSLPFNKNTLKRKIDFKDWYTGSITAFCDRVCGIVNKYFPNTKKGLPLGFPDEPLEIGQIKSEIVKVAVKYNVIARWTGMAFLEDFGKSDVLAKRISTPSNFYGASFGTEAALKLDEKNAGNAIYECLANASTLIHNDPKNIKLGGKLWKTLIPKLKVSKPEYNTAIFYPLEGEMLELNGVEPDYDILPFERAFYGDEVNIINSAFKSSSIAGHSKNEDIEPINYFILRCASLRHSFDYCLIDSLLIHDGILKGISNLFFVISGPIPKETVTEIKKFISNGGKVYFRHGIVLTELESGKPIDFYGETYYDFVNFVEPYSSIRCANGISPLDYITIHKDFVSVYSPFFAEKADTERTIRYLKK